MDPVSFFSHMNISKGVFMVPYAITLKLPSYLQIQVGVEFSCFLLFSENYLQFSLLKKLVIKQAMQEGESPGNKADREMNTSAFTFYGLVDLSGFMQFPEFDLFDGQHELKLIL